MLENSILGICISLVVAILVVLGILLGQAHTQQSCNDFGKARINGVLYECKKLEGK